MLSKAEQMLMEQFERKLSEELRAREISKSCVLEMERRDRIEYAGEEEDYGNE